MNVSEFSDDVYTTNSNSSSSLAIPDLIWNIILYVAVCVGIPGNILSAIVWLRRHIAVNSSSSVYLATLAINDLTYLIVQLLQYNFDCKPVMNSWHCVCGFYLSRAAFNLELLLVLGFSVERLIVIIRPLQVRVHNFQDITFSRPY